MKTNKKFILPLILLAGGSLALYFILKGKKKPDIAPAPPAPANLPPPSFNVPAESVVKAATKVIQAIKKRRDEKSK